MKDLTTFAMFCIFVQMTAGVIAFWTGQPATAAYFMSWAIFAYLIGEDKK
jgi:hypothetical protein